MREGGDIHIRVYEKTEGYECIYILGWKTRSYKAFYSTKQNGTGLRLAITYKIIEEYQGKVAIQSSVEIGTKVEIFLMIV